MILPSKHISPDRSLLAVGGEILGQLPRPRTVSEVWEAVRRDREARGAPRLAFDWFVLALTFLYAISAVRLDDGRLTTEARR